LKKLSFILFALLLLNGCLQQELFEKNIEIPEFQWKTNFSPEINFTITDTASTYRIFFIIRHTNAYRYNNVWVKLSSAAPGEKNIQTQQFDLPLASPEKWLGTGMDDIFEHRILLYNEPVKFKNFGRYAITITHMMRDNPLLYVMNVGIRLEKIPH
jgi:gliding motility-associated lipoprotein GldH